MNKKAQEKINKAKVRILQKSPFFSYLSLYLKLEEDTNPANETIGVTPKGNVYYNPKFILEINDEELLGVLAHEILHLSLLHLTRVGARHREAWNVATDLCINSMLQKEGFDLPKKGLIPTYNSFTIGQTKIEKIDEKIAEQIYDEIMVEVEKGKGKGKGKGKETDLSGGFDEHLYDKNDKDDGKDDGLSESEKAEVENEWLNRMNEAYIHAKERGKTPKGIERYIDSLKKAKINWRGLMNKYLTAQIPYDYTWKRRGKKSYATETYLPDTIKDMIDVCVLVDTSGSIGKKELAEFLSEIVGLAQTYKSQINMRLMTHDTKIHEDLAVSNGNVETIKQLKGLGGGGTSHIQPFEYVKEKYPDCKCVISFTDGWSDMNEIDFKKCRFNNIVVINKGGTDKDLEGKKCVKILMEDY